jgi:2-polyprenyl-6-methoxyphenol hydroxylase-like FAD-dependent oxidoreductase
MATIVVLGGGICGLAGAMMLARDGHEVTVLERDPAPVPASPQEAFAGWERAGVAQFQQAHNLHSRGREVLDEELPEVCEALLEAGCVHYSPIAIMPPTIADREPRVGDERFATITGRRATMELVVARAAAAEPRLDVRRGVTVDALLTAPLDGRPHVTGVRTDAGDELQADLVVDGMGRRSQLPRLLRAAGAAPLHEEVEDSGFVYYTRFFSGNEMPQYRAGLLMPLGTISVLTLPGDNGTWSVTLLISGADAPLKRLRDADRWTAVVRACPRQAHWVDAEPITGVVPMGGVLDRFRRLVVDGAPVVTGLALVADACTCTNPSQGRGITLGLMHAQRLRDVVRANLDDGPLAFAQAWDAATEAELVPWYRETVRSDRMRLAQIEALRRGARPPAPPEGIATLLAALPPAAMQDADLFRAFQSIICCMELADAVLARPQVADRIREVSANGGPGPPPGPDREQLLALLA